jgi:hypothetical protein
MPQITQNGVSHFALLNIGRSHHKNYSAGCVNNYLFANIDTYCIIFHLHIVVYEWSQFFHHLIVWIDHKTNVAIAQAFVNLTNFIIVLDYPHCPLACVFQPTVEVDYLLFFNPN